MTPSECVELVEVVRQLCPGQKLEQNTWRAWLVVLGDYSQADCLAGARTAYREHYNAEEFGYRRIEADDIDREVRAIRARRIDAAGDALLPPTYLSVRAAIDWQRRATKAAANGDPIPPNGRGALKARPVRQALTQQSGRSTMDT